MRNARLLSYRIPETPFIVDVDKQRSLRSSTAAQLVLDIQNTDTRAAFITIRLRRGYTVSYRADLMRRYCDGSEMMIVMIHTKVLVKSRQQPFLAITR